ncbi:MAG: hypothetical protein ACHREM_07740 [Polyangiales bacterium]
MPEQDLAAKAAVVSARFRANGAAANDLREANLELARAILGTLEPALRAICVPIVVRHHGLPLITIPVPVRGVQLAVDVRSYEGSSPSRALNGSIVHGVGIFVVEDGGLVTTTLLERQDGSLHVEPERTTLEAIAEWFEPSSLVHDMTYALGRALDQQLHGKIDKRTEQLREQAADLRAVTRLLTRTQRG